MRVLFDTNVVLDLLLARQPHASAARLLTDHVARGDITGVLGATTITTIYYIGRRQLGRVGVRRALRTLLQIFDFAPVTRAVIEQALDADFTDFEDAVLDCAGELADVDAVVTRDPRGFARSAHRVFAPADLLAALAPRTPR